MYWPKPVLEYSPSLGTSARAPAKTSTADPWEQENYSKIIELKSDAERLAIAGKLPEAHEKYRQIMLLVAGRRIKDPLLFDEQYAVKPAYYGVLDALWRR